MKKTVLFLSGLALLASCSSDEPAVLNAPEVAAIEPLTTEPIYGEKVKLSMGSIVKVTPTKGTGTVGSTNAADNKWQYEDIYVLMTTTGKDVNGELLPEMVPGSYSLSPDEPMLDTEKPNVWGYVNVKEAGQQFNGSFFSRPTTDATTSPLSHFTSVSPYTENSQLRYYPPKAVCQFYGYYLDDAAKNIDTNGHPAISYNDEKDAVKAEFQIDGSQDIMVGMAKNYYGNYPFFCAATSRKGHHPTITMKHVTSRLTFEIIPGTDDDAATAERKFYIESIGVNSVNEGVLYVAKKDASDPSVEWAVPNDPANETPILYLKDAATGTPSFTDGKPKMTAFSEKELIFDTTQPLSLSGALFLCPQQSYGLTIKVKENIGSVAAENWQERTFTEKLELKEHTTFEPGKSYHVKVTIYRNENIKISASLEGWEEVSDTGLDNIGVDPNLDM